jgi:hypothetical protein
MVEHGEGVGLSIRFFGARHVAKGAQRRQARIGRRQTLANIILGGFSEMSCDFLPYVPRVP